MSTLHPIPAVLTAIFILLALRVGVSRIYIRVHYPSDVVGAWTMAVGIYSLILFLGLK
jgi:membrane-associated phospholipid phosphatase